MEDQKTVVKNESARTMRIDIHPDVLEEPSEVRRPTTVVRRGPNAPSFKGRQGDHGHTSDYGKLLQSIYDAVLITDLFGHVVDYNSRAISFFACDNKTMTDANVIDLISGAEKALLGSITANLDEHRYTMIEAHCIRYDSSIFPAEIAVNRIDFDDGEQLCFFVRDVSVRKRAQDALEDAIQRLEAHDRARSQFVSNVSHELRTPLTSMIYAVSNILKGVVGPLSDHLRRYLEMMDGDCKRLLGTVNDILDLSKMESKTLTLAMSKVPFARLVSRSVDSLRVQAEQKSLTVDVDISAGGRFVTCDLHKMERVVINIVGNAIKFTSDNGALDIAVEDDPEKEGFIRMSFRDDGIGIPPEALESVTNRYFTVGEQASGSGLGLSISKEIVEIHGGSLDIASPPPGYDKGTIVTVSLPYIESPTVLVADDEEEIAALIKGQLNKQGYRVLLAQNGEDALALMEEDKPDLVVLDLIMPDMSGTEVILKMKSNENLLRLPVIAITGGHIGRVKAEILNNFSVPVISKPWDETELLDRVTGAFVGAAELYRQPVS